MITKHGLITPGVICYSLTLTLVIRSNFPLFPVMFGVEPNPFSLLDSPIIATSREQSLLYYSLTHVKIIFLECVRNLDVYKTAQKGS